MTTTITLPNARIDLFKLGLTGRIVGAGGMSAAWLIEKLKDIGEITTPKSKKGGRYIQVTRRLETDDGQSAGDLRFDLYPEYGDDIVFGNRSSVQGNGMQILRAVLGEKNCGGLSFDGKTNVLGTSHSGEGTTARQLGLLIEAVQIAIDAFATVFEDSWKPDKVWLKSAEACRDMAVADSIAATRILQHLMVSGAKRKKHDEYARLGSDEQKRIPTLRFITSEGEPEDKIYAKRRDTLRFEVSCPSRKKVAASIGRGVSNFSSYEVSLIFLDFLSAAEARIDKMEREACAALSSEVGIAEVLLRLRPLLDLAAGVGKAKGPPSEDAQEASIDAIEALLSSGFYDAHGHHGNTVIRVALNALAQDGGPLEKHWRRAIYYLKPELARACSIMRVAS